MMQPTTSVESRRSTSGASVDPAPAVHLGSTDGLDERIAALTEALRSVVAPWRRERGAEGDLDRGAIALLHTLNERQPVRGSDLAVCTGLDASTVSRHTKALIDAGYVVTSSDPDDARARLLELSDTGATLFAGIKAKKVARVRAALANWPDSDIDTLTLLLNRFGAALEHEDS